MLSHLSHVTLLSNFREAGSCDLELESMQEAFLSFSNAALWSDKPEIYKPLAVRQSMAPG